MHLPRPFKNPGYNKNVNRRAKNMKAIISQERERERAERERRRVLGKSGSGGGGGGGEGGGGEDAEAMNVEPVDGVSLDALAEEVPTCNVYPFPAPQLTLTRAPDTSIEAPLSIWPPKHYCDITGLEVRSRPFSSSLPTHTRPQAPYTDPSTGLRFHDKSIYDVVKGLVSHFLPPSPLADTPQSTSTAKDYLSARGVSTVVK
jgi:INO80 complex subunit C